LHQPADQRLEKDRPNQAHRKLARSRAWRG
jgi:hypothetical protein